MHTEKVPTNQNRKHWRKASTQSSTLSLPPSPGESHGWLVLKGKLESQSHRAWVTPPSQAPRPCFNSLVLTAMTWNVRGNDSPFVWPRQGTCSADPSTTAHGHLKSRGKKQGALADCSINHVLWSRAASNRGATVTSNSHRLHLFLNWFRRWKRKTHD